VKVVSVEGKFAEGKFEDLEVGQYWHVAKCWQTLLLLSQTASCCKRGVISLFLESGRACSLQHGSEKNLHLGLFGNQFHFIIVTLKEGADYERSRVWIGIASTVSTQDS
jgi:hypothetical protein